MYVGVPVCLGLAPLSGPPGGSELAGVLLGIKPGPGARKKKNGCCAVYCSCGCLEVTGRKHARFVKNEQRPEA